MNKAFVREAEDETAPKCPRCHAIGRPVGPGVLAANLPPDAAAVLTSSSHFCPNPTCDVAYFDAHGQTAPAALLRQWMWPKSDDPSSLLCPCLGLSAADILADARRADPTRIRRLLAQSQSDPGRCAAATADGGTCTSEAQRLYLKNLKA